MEIAYLLFTLMCPLSMIGLMGWWVWSMRRSSSGSNCHKAPVRSAADESEIVRMRAQLDQLEAQAHDIKQLTGSGSGDGHGRVLERRYAAGDIDREEFLQHREDLARRP